MKRLALLLILVAGCQSPTKDIVGKYQYYQETAPRCYNSGINTIEFTDEGKVLLDCAENVKAEGTWRVSNEMICINCNYHLEGVFFIKYKRDYILLTSNDGTLQFRLIQ